MREYYESRSALLDGTVSEWRDLIGCGGSEASEPCIASFAPDSGSSMTQGTQPIVLILPYSSPISLYISHYISLYLSISLPLSSILFGPIIHAFSFAFPFRSSALAAIGDQAPISPLFYSRAFTAITVITGIDRP